MATNGQQAIRPSFDDVDKEGFLRSQGSLIQTIGRAARHLEGRAILYADKMTDSMRRAIDETDRRREKALGRQVDLELLECDLIFIHGWLRRT